MDFAALKPEPSAVAGLLHSLLSALPVPLLLKDAEIALHGTAGKKLSLFFFLYFYVIGNYNYNYKYVCIFL